MELSGVCESEFLERLVQRRGDFPLQLHQRLLSAETTFIKHFTQYRSFQSSHYSDDDDEDDEEELPGSLDGLQWFGGLDDILIKPGFQILQLFLLS